MGDTADIKYNADGITGINFKTVGGSPLGFQSTCGATTTETDFNFFDPNGGPGSFEI